MQYISFAVVETFVVCGVGILLQPMNSVQQEEANWNAGTETTLPNDL
jgi:hypothetical protein